MQSAISASEADLPTGLPYPPTYAKVNPSDPPILTIALTSENVSLEKLSDVADTFMLPRLSQVSGVGHVTVQGNMRPAVRIQADLSKLAAYGISMETLRAAIAEANVAGAKGTLNGAQKAFTIGTNDQLEDADVLWRCAGHLCGWRAGIAARRRQDRQRHRECARLRPL